MRAVGRLIGRGRMGYEQAELYVNGVWQVWAISNYQDVPNMAPVGLFSFCPEDQFCKWIDPNKS